MKNKTAPPGFTRFFRFAGLLPIGAGFAKRNDGPQCPPQAKKIGIWGAFYTKNTSPPPPPPRGGQPPPRAEFFLAFGGVVHKTHVAGLISGVFFGRKTPPNLKISASGGPNPQMFENTPPPCCKIGNNKGGFSRGGWGGFSTISVDRQTRRQKLFAFLCSRWCLIGPLILL